MNNITPRSALLSTEARIRSVLGGSIGNLVEWYDWLAYSTFSLYFAHIFFPSSDRTVQLLYTAGVFAVGYLMRPIGALLFGWFADRKGRRSALTVSVLLMCFGSLLMAFMPGYSQIGIAAPILLLFARMLQGLSVGGEYGTSAAYLMEIAPPAQRGFYVSFHYTTLLAGQLLATGVLILLQRILLTEQQLDDWGWRIAFVIGGAFALIAMRLRTGIDESPEFMVEKASGTVPKNPLLLLLKHPKAVLTVVGLSLGGTVAVNTYSVYMPKFLTNTSGLSRDDATLVSAISIVVFMCLQPIVGALSDRIGRKPVLIAFGVMGSLSSVPLLEALAKTPDRWSALLLVLCGVAISTGYSAINATVKAELFPVGLRAIGVGLPYALVVAVFGGTSEYFGLLFKSMHNEKLYYYYVASCILVSLLVYINIKETAPSYRRAKAIELESAKQEENL